MSEKKPGLVDELKRWLEIEDPNSGSDELEQLQNQLAMETDPKKREQLKAQIKAVEDNNENAELPTSGFTGVY